VGRGERNLEERDRRHIPRHLPVCPVQHSSLLGNVEDPVSLIEVTCHEPLAVAGVVLGSSAAVDALELDAIRVELPGEERDVEVPFREDLPEEDRRRGEGRYDFDSDLAQLRLHERDDQRPRRDAGARHEAQ
jgi:hypothetical protein